MSYNMENSTDRGLMFVRIYKGGKNRQFQYVGVFETVRNKQGKVSQKVIENLGRLDKLLEKDPQALKKLHDKYGGDRQEKDSKAASIRIEQSIKTINEPIAKLTSSIELRYGHYVLRHLWHSVLQLQHKFDYLQRNSRYRFDLNETACFLSSVRILAPSSIFSSYDNQDKYLGAPIDKVGLDSLYDTYGLFKQHKDSLMTLVNRRLDTEIKDNRVSLVFYDVTNAYFETAMTDKEQDNEQKDFADELLRMAKQARADGELGEEYFGSDGELLVDRLPAEFIEQVIQADIQYLRMRGPSKEKRFDLPLVSIVLVVDRFGMPMDFEVFAGNRSEFKSMGKVIGKLRAKYKIDQAIVVADKGLNSGSNLKMLEQSHLGYLMSQKISNLSVQMTERLLDQTKYQWINPKDESMGRYQLIEKWERQSAAGPVECSLLFTFNEKRKRRDEKILELWRQQVLDKMGKGEKIKPKKSGWASLAKTEKDLKDGAKVVGVDEKLYQKRKALCGYAALIYKQAPQPEKDNQKPTTEERTISEAKANETARYLASKYSQINQIEDCFRIMKSNLGLRPMYVRNSDHVKGHITACVIALVLVRLIQRRLEAQATPMSINRICRALQTAKVDLWRTQSGQVIVHPIREGLDSFRVGKERMNYQQLLKELELFNKQPHDIDLIMQACGLKPLNACYSRIELGRCLKTTFASDQDMVSSLLWQRLN